MLSFPSFRGDSEKPEHVIPNLKPSLEVAVVDSRNEIIYTVISRYSDT